MKIGDKITIVLEVVEVRESKDGKHYMLWHSKADWMTDKILIAEKDLATEAIK